MIPFVMVSVGATRRPSTTLRYARDDKSVATSAMCFTHYAQDDKSNG